MNKQNCVVEGLIILDTYPDCYIACEHDILYAGAYADKVTEEDREDLESLGWFVDKDTGSWAIHV